MTIQNKYTYYLDLCLLSMGFVMYVINKGVEFSPGCLHVLNLKLDSIQHGPVIVHTRQSCTYSVWDLTLHAFFLKTLQCTGGKKCLFLWEANTEIL